MANYPVRKTKKQGEAVNNRFNFDADARILMMIIIILYPAFLFSFSLQVGQFGGLRQVADAEIKKVYGPGLIHFSFAELDLNGIIMGAGYEGGYSKKGMIGLFNEPTTLTMHGYEIYVGYQIKLRSFVPYCKAGFGSYSYKQTIESAYLTAFKVDHKQRAPLVAAGLKVFPGKHIFLAAEIKYVPLKVKPFEEEVDLSGLRWLAGLGFSFQFSTKRN